MASGSSSSSSEKDQPEKNVGGGNTIGKATNAGPRSSRPVLTVSAMVLRLCCELIPGLLLSVRLSLCLFLQERTASVELGFPWAVVRRVVHVT